MESVIGAGRAATPERPPVMRASDRPDQNRERTLVKHAALLAIALLLLPVETDAQVRGSERALVSQTSDGTVVTIDYGRPHTRGRAPVFGGLVGWEHVWTPGANEATVFEASKPVTLDGVEVPEGRYSMWMIPRESGPWELVLDPDDRLYHTQPPSPDEDQIRLEVSPESVAHTEALTWDFPTVDPEGMDLRFRWATTAVSLRIGVEPTRVLTLSPEEAAPLEGSYTVVIAGPPPPGVPADAELPRMEVEVRFADDRLEGRIVGGPPMLPDRFVLIPAAERIFNPAWMMDGEIFEVEVDMYFEFDVVDGAARGFDVRGLEDRLMMRAEANR